MMTAEEFERAYAERSGLTIDRLRQYRTPRPCDCEYEGCEGWQMVSHLEAACIDAAKLAGLSRLQWESQFFNEHHRLPELSDFEAA